MYVNNNLLEFISAIYFFLSRGVTESFVGDDEAFSRISSFLVVGVYGGSFVLFFAS
jgi:hypothetical protein